MKYRYSRIPTIGQNADLQLKALERAGVAPGTFSRTSYPARRHRALFPVPLPEKLQHGTARRHVNAHTPHLC
jgi:hypothetical protein